MRKQVMFLLLIVLVSGFVSADFTKGNLSHSITKSYSPEDFLKGWINISLDKEPSTSVFETSKGDKISLIDLLKLGEETGSLTYSCNPLDCTSAYASVDEGETTKTFSLANRETKVIGLRISGGSGFANVQDFSINVDSDAEESTFRQLFIDLLDDGDFEWISETPSGNFYNEDYGCFDFTGTESTIAKPSVYCEKINIPIAPEVEIGANIINPLNPTARFKFTIKDAATETNTANCYATALQEGRIGCIPNFKIDKQEDYYICIEPKDTADNDKYKILSENSGNVCGYATEKKYPKDYNIFAKPGRFEAVGNFDFNSDETGEDLEGEIEEYIFEEYDNDCSDECIIPIRFTSGKNQEQILTLSSVGIRYTLSGESHPETDFPIYNVTETPAKISSDFIQLILDGAEFSLPKNFGSTNFSLSLGNEKIFSESINIERVPQILDLNPRTVAAGMPTTFSVKVKTFDNSTRITKYEWDFDGEIQNTTENSAVYAFGDIGTHEVIVTTTDSKGKISSKVFPVDVASPKNAVNTLLKRNINSINGIKSLIESLTLLEGDSLNSLLGLEEAEMMISDLQQANASAVSDDDYILIMSDLVSLTLPKSVDITNEANAFPFFPNEDGIDLEALKTAGGGDFGDGEKYADAIITWNLVNNPAEISSKEFTAVYENHKEELMNSFELQVSDSSVVQGTYLIMPEFENLVFAEDYGEEIDNGFVSIQIEGEETIEFVTTEDVDFSEMPAFISPPLSRLSVQRESVLNTDIISTFTITILVVLLVGFLGFIAYIAMQQWYKRKYETYLFKNRNDLFNIVSYVHNMKKQGIEDSKVSSGLKKTGWNSEQVSYIMKKYYGKRTGMFEIPILELFKFMKKPKTFFGNSNKSQGATQSRKI